MIGQPRAGSRLRRLFVQALQFGAIGAAGLLIDLTVFNALRLTVLSPERLNEGPLIAKVVSTIVAIVANWLGNRYWTFAGDRQSSTTREGIEFFAVSLAGMAIGVGCLWVSHYVLGYRSLVADNIASNVIGLALGSVFRFVLYRYWVFAPSRRAARQPAAQTAAQSAAEPAVAP